MHFGPEIWEINGAGVNEPVAQGLLISEVIFLSAKE